MNVKITNWKGVIKIPKKYMTDLNISYRNIENQGMGPIEVGSRIITIKTILNKFDKLRNLKKTVLTAQKEVNY